MEILITWTSSWIWKEILNKYINNQKYSFYSISKSSLETKNYLKIENSLDREVYLKIENSLKEKNNKLTHFTWNINDDEFIDKIVWNIEKIDFLILNAGIWYFDNFLDISLENHIDIINTNLLANIKLVYKLLKKVKTWIIFIWSVSSKKSWKYGASYSASKFGLRWFALNLKNEFPKIKIHLINPKIVKTNFHKNSKVEILGKYEETNISEILETIENIFIWEEKRFEIDL